MANPRIVKVSRLAINAVLNGEWINCDTHHLSIGKVVRLRSAHSEVKAKVCSLSSGRAYFADPVINEDFVPETKMAEPKIAKQKKSLSTVQKARSLASIREPKRPKPLLALKPSQNGVFAPKREEEITTSENLSNLRHQTLSERVLEKKLNHYVRNGIL